jgi:hypothetical protein
MAAKKNRSAGALSAPPPPVETPETAPQSEPAPPDTGGHAEPGPGPQPEDGSLAPAPVLVRLAEIEILFHPRRVMQSDHKHTIFWDDAAGEILIKTRLGTEKRLCPVGVIRTKAPGQ